MRLSKLAVVASIFVVGCSSESPEAETAADDSALTLTSRSALAGMCTCTAKGPTGYVVGDPAKPERATVDRKHCAYDCECLCFDGAKWSQEKPKRVSVTGEGYVRINGPYLYSWNNEQECLGQETVSDPRFENVNKAEFRSFQYPLETTPTSDDQPLLKKRLVAFCRTVMPESR